MNFLIASGKNVICITQVFYSIMILILMNVSKNAKMVLSHIITKKFV